MPLSLKTIRFSILISVIALTACTAKYPTTDLTGYIQKSIRLANGLGIVSVYLPAELDTFYTTVNYGEYHCAEIKLHRFVSKKYTCCLSSSSDYSYSDLSDSLYQFSITQTFNPDCEEFVNINAEVMKSVQDNYIAIDKNIAPQRKYFMKEINGQQFIISELSTTINNFDLRELVGITDANGRMVKFIYKCYCRNGGNFIERMMASLETIQITPDSKTNSN